MAYLYKNSRGEERNRHSYSAGTVYDQCPYKYYLQKVLGWRTKDNRASFLFGRALEESIQFYHDSNGDDAVKDFKRRWNLHEEAKLQYTETEKDWENLF